MSEKPWLSIITVVYNSENLLQGTIDSIASQSLQNFQYIIVDGKSNDGTLDIIKNNQQHISKWISEVDSGLYDAMNKALEMADGKYVWFINSGDKFMSASVIEKLYKQAKENNFPDIIYGETMIIDENDEIIGPRRLKTPDNLQWKSLKNGLVVCHQSILVSKEVAPKYNLKYTIAADYDWILQSLKNSTNILNSKIVLSKYLDNGFSKNNIRKALRQRFGIMIRFYGFIPTLLQHFIIGFRFFTFLIKNRRF